MNMRKLAVVLTVLCAILVFCLSPSVFADGELEIIGQPEDVVVHYPDEASFHVEVNDPELVASWQWYLMDIEDQVFELKGTSALTDTLVLPSTDHYSNTLRFYCEITGKDGTVLTSDMAFLENPDRDIDKPVLYVGDYAVEPGETLDLADTTLGTGKVTFDSDAVNITLDNVHLSTEVMTFDAQLSSALGIFFDCRNVYNTEYYFHVVGDCVLDNTFYDPEYNSAGVVFNAFFGTDAEDLNKPMIIIDGDGTLTLKGGSNGIYTDANVEIRTRLTTESNGEIYCDAITCHSLYIDDSAELELYANGSGIVTRGDLYVYSGAKVKIESKISRVSVGPSMKKIVSVSGTMNANAAQIDIIGIADAERFVPYGSFVAYYTGIAMNGIGACNLDGTEMRIELKTENADQFFAMSFIAITGDQPSNAIILTNGAKLTVNVDDEYSRYNAGIYTDGGLELGEGCELNVNVRGIGETAGVELGQSFDLTDAKADITVNYIPDEEEEVQPTYATYGLVCAGANVNLPNKESYLHVTAQDGLALGADTGETEEEPSAYEEGYSPKVLHLGEGTAINTPKKGVISLCGVPGYGSYIRAEAVFDPENTAMPAAEVLFSAAAKGGNTALYIGLGAAAVGAVTCSVALFSKKKKTSPEAATEEE